VESLSILANGMGKVVVQAPCQQLLCQLGHLKRSVLFRLLPVDQIIDLCNEVLNFAQKEGESLGIAWSRYNHFALLGPELSIPDAMFMQHFLHGLGTESTKYLDMTSGGVVVHCTVEKWKSILDKILLVTLLEDL
jgi:hypothetical protein